MDQTANSQNLVTLQNYLFFKIGPTEIFGRNDMNNVDKALTRLNFHILAHHRSPWTQYFAKPVFCQNFYCGKSCL
jgi:hypothetical protein